MWIFTKDGFYSIVEKKDAPEGRLVVRSRVKADLERLMKKSGFDTHISESGRDYPYRIYIPRDLLADYLARAVFSLHYDNFKDMVQKKDPERERIYERVWVELFRLTRNWFLPYRLDRIEAKNNKKK